MCHRKLPPSFWNSAYKPPQLATGSNFDYSRDPYFPSSWYSLQNNWPYRLPPHSHTDLGGSLPYSSFDAPGKFGSTYQSLMFPGSYDSRQSKYDFAKNMESLAGSSSYYGLSRLGMDFTGKGNVEPPVTGIKIIFKKLVFIFKQIKIYVVGIIILKSLFLRINYFKYIPIEAFVCIDRVFLLPVIYLA